MPISRRQFFKTFGLSGLVGTSMLASIAYSQNRTEAIETTNTDILLENLPQDFTDYRIGFISDLHLGECVTEEWIESAISTLNENKPDIVLIGGDLIWVADALYSQVGLALRRKQACFGQDKGDIERAHYLYESLADLLTVLSAPDGVFSVYGNHDGWLAPKACQKYLEARTVRLLCNNTVEIKRGAAQLSVTGVDDYWTGVPRLGALAHARKSNEIRVILAHNPDYISDLLETTNCDFDLALCGHTHGGQLKLPVFGAPFYNVRDYRLAEGLFKHATGKYVYTTRGVGVVGLPIRINCPPEVSILTLKQV